MSNKRRWLRWTAIDTDTDRDSDADTDASHGPHHKINVNRLCVN